MIEVTNLTKSFVHKGERLTIFKDISFRIEKGESVALLGKNGAGKSTLLRILGGIDQPDSGTVKSDVSISWPVGLVGGFQGSLTARENVIFVSKIYLGDDREKIKKKVRIVENFAELGEYFDRPFKTYSSGMKSRVTFGLSMAFRFDVYLMDEVSSAGDERFRRKSRRWLNRIKKKSDLILVDHNLWGLEFHCERALLLHDGKITQFNDLDEAIVTHKAFLKEPSLR